MSENRIEEYLRLPYTIEVFRDNDEENPGWVARVAELPGCMTQGDTFEELGEMIEDAMRGWIETAMADGIDIPLPRPDENYSGKFIVRVPKSLHRELVDIAKRENVSLNMFVSTALGKSVGQVTDVRHSEILDEALSPTINWPRLSETARRIMIARGLSAEVQAVEEQMFASWIDDYLDQAQTAMSRAEHQQALKYVRALRQGLDQLCDQSPLVRTYCRAIAFLEDQIVATYRMYAGIMEQNLIQQRVLAQVRESTQTKLSSQIVANEKEEESFEYKDKDFTYSSGSFAR